MSYSFERSWLDFLVGRRRQQHDQVVFAVATAGTSVVLLAWPALIRGSFSLMCQIKVIIINQLDSIGCWPKWFGLRCRGCIKRLRIIIVLVVIIIDRRHIQTRTWTRTQQSNKFRLLIRCNQWRGGNKTDRLRKFARRQTRRNSFLRCNQLAAANETKATATNPTVKSDILGLI